MFVADQLSLRLVPDELWALAEPLIPKFRPRPQGGGFVVARGSSHGAGPELTGRVEERGAQVLQQPEAVAARVTPRLCRAMLGSRW